MRALRRLALLVALLAAGCGGVEAVTPGEPLLVAAAADLQPAFAELGDGFEQATGQEVTFSFGSSGHLAQQIVEGAPMDLYAAADASFVDRVVAAGRASPGTRATYARGRIAVWTPSGRWGGWDDLADVAEDPTVRTVAIANPEHAPYGRAAREALDAAGVWRQVEPRVVYGENVADTQRLAATGNADVAVVAVSLALAAEHDGDGRWMLVPAELHEPLRQDLVVVADDPDRAALAADFIDYVSGDEGREVMRRFGFLPPGGELPEARGE